MLVPDSFSPQHLLELLATSPSSFLRLEFVFSRLLYLLLHLTAHSYPENNPTAPTSSDDSVAMPRPKTLITVTIDSIEPMKVHVPPTVRRHKNTKLVTFRHQNKQYSNVEVCCFIFYPPISNSLIPSDPNFSETSHIAIKPALLLLFQRNLPGTRIHDLWDVPGGGPKPGEPTVLHAVARNTFETTRLRTKSIPREVGYGEKFKFRELQFFKWNFMVEVEELAYNGETGEYPGLADVRIEFDRDEHQMFVWASEQEIKDDKYAAVTPKQKELMLLAFRLRRDDEEELRNVAIQQEELEEEKKALAVRREQKRKEQRTALAATALTVKARKLFPDDYATGPEKHDNDGNEDRNADHEDEDDNYRKVQWQRRPRLWLREDRPDILVGRSAKSDVKTQDDNKEDNKKADKDAEEGGKEEGGEEEGG